MIYLFNQTEELIDVIDKASLAEFTHTIELNQFDRSSFEIPVDYKPDIIKEAQFFGFQSRDRAFCLFRISEKSYDLGLTIEGIDRAESDLHSFIIEDKRPSGTADQVLRGILEGTGYQLGDTNRLTVNGKMSFYYISVRQALVKIIESYGCEFQIRYTFVENKIIGRYIDLYQRFGHKTGHQFEYGSNILNVTYEESSDEVVTALIGRGKGEQNTDDNGEATGGYGRRIQFKDVVWAVAKGDPVDKPAGQNYVANEAARNNYGLHQNGVIKHRFGVYTNENIEDPVELLKATYKELQRLSVPIATFKANLLDLANAIEQDIWIGDSVGIVRDQIGIAFEARIHKLVIDKLDDNRSVAELGDYQTLQAKDRTTRQQAIIDAVSGFSESLIEKAIADEVDRRDKEFDEKMRINKLEFDNALESAKAKAEEVKRELSDTIDQRFSSFDNGPLQDAKRKAEEALRNAGASSLLAQEAKRIGLDSIARLEEFKRQTTSAQTALSGDLDILKRTIASDILPKQEQVTVEIAKQVEALVQTKKELAGVKSAQSTYEETTTRRLSELTNLANGKASKSELTQTAEELTSKIASLQVGGRNLYVLSKNKDISRSSHLTDLKFDISSGEISFRATGLDPYFGEATIHPKSVSDRNGVRIPVILGKAIYVTVSNPIFIKNYISYFDKNGNTVRSYKYYKSSSFVISSKELEGANFITIRFGCGGSDFEVGSVIKTKIKVEYGTIPTDWSPAPEDIEGQISIVESNFRQRADALDAGVNRLTEGLRTKADISALNVTAENIRQSVKSFETSTQNKLDQKLSQAEFEVRAGSIRQEILNATKDKADKTLVVAEAGKLREEFSNLRVGGTNLLKGSKGPFLPDRKPANFDNNVLYAEQTSIYMEQGQEYIVSAKTDGTFTAHHDGNKESDNVVLWIMDKDVRNYQIVSDLKTGTTGTKIIWNNPTGIYHLRVNTYHKEATKSVWDMKIEKGNVATDWSPAFEDTDGLITEAKATFERTAQGLRTDLSAIQTYVGQDGQRQEALQRYARDESARQVSAVREQISRDYVGKSTYQEDVRGIERKFEAITNPQNGSIATKIAQYKQTVDGQFASIASQVAGKANQTDFQRVQETSRLYERILGNTNNSISDNVARMALTNQLFQVEVGKYSVSGPNLIKNSDFKNGTNEWTSTQNLGRLVKHGFYHNSQKYLMRLSNSTQSENYLYSHRFELERNTDYVLNFRGFNNSALVSYDVFILGRRAGETNGFTIIKQVVSSKKLSTARCEDVSVTFNSGEMDNAFIRFDNNGSSSGTADLYITEIDLYKGYKPRPWQPHPEDVVADANAKLEATQTKMTQLAGSWAVQNLTSAGALVSGLNLGANGHNRLDGKLTHITGETLIDKAVIKSAMVDKLKTANFEAGSVTTIVLDAEAVTAEKLKVDQAFFNKLVANEAYLSQLFAKQAFINRVQSVAIDASQVRSGILSGDRIYGGTIRGASIYGGTLTGHTQIQLGSYGSFDTVNGGLQINVPRTVNAKDGLGVQFIGSYGRGENVPYGLFIYKDSDFTVGGTAETSDDFLLTVEGYINAKGIGWLKTGKGSVNGKTTGTIGLWNSDNVSLSFGGSGNDIYYSYNGTAYSLWSVVNQHFSDRRLKENIVDCEHTALDYIHQFKFKEYDWKKQEDRPRQAHTNIGLIAQEVQAVDPTLVYENGDTLNLDNLRLTNIALKAIQELALENRKLTHRLENLENERRTA